MKLSFIEPLWLEDDYYKEIYLSSLKHAESAYLDLLKQWDKKSMDSNKQELFYPNSLKTELVMTGFDSDWEHFF